MSKKTDRDAEVERIIAEREAKAKAAEASKPKPPPKPATKPTPKPPTSKPRHPDEDEPWPASHIAMRADDQPKKRGWANMTPEARAARTAGLAKTNAARTEAVVARAETEAKVQATAKVAKRKGKPLPTAAEIAAAQTNFIEFVRLAWQSQGKLQLKWFHTHIGGLLDQMAKAVALAVQAQDEDNLTKLALARKMIRRLSVSIPCQHGKSQICTVYFPAYVLGICPDARIIFSAATAQFAQKWSRHVMRVVNSEVYALIFPDTTLGSGRGKGTGGDDTKRTSGEWEISGHQGSYLAIGVAGAVGGNTADLYIIDDPTANTEIAHSPTERDKQWDWFCEDVTSRGHNDYCVLVVASRRHPEDLVGRIMESDAKHPDPKNPWEFVVIRAIKEAGDIVYPGDTRAVGEALWPERHDLDRLRDLERKNSWNFQSQYQQNPLPDGGVVFKAGHFKRWVQEPTGSGEWLSSWDCSSGGQGDRRSYSVGQVWFRPWGKSTIYLMDQVRGQWDMPALRAEFRLLLKKRPECRKHIIEDGGFGRGVYQELKNDGDIPGLLLLKPTLSKAQRAQSVLAYFEAGNVYIPPDMPEYEWTTRYLVEMTRFTGAAGETNDQVDATTQALSNFGPVLTPSYNIQVLESRPNIFGYSR